MLAITWPRRGALHSVPGCAFVPGQQPCAIGGMIKPLTYLSVCSGIEAATVAWHPLGWRPWAFSEIDPFPSAVLAHHYGSNLPGQALPSNGVPNLGDMTKFQEWPDGAIDLLVGGTPCQDYSVAGKRAGMAGERGALTLTFLEIAERYRPTWIVWENVPGVLSSNQGRDFATFLRDLGQLGYGWAYRVLDAQYVRTCGRPYAVPQRRRRVFVVGYLGDWRPPAAVFLEPEGLRGDPSPRREAGQGAAPTLAARTRGGGGLGTDFDLDGGLICAPVAPTLNAHFGEKQGLEDQHVNGGCGLFVAHSLRGEGFDASEDGTGRGIPLVPYAFAQNTRDEVRLMGGDGSIVGALGADPGMKQQCYVAQPVAFDCKGSEAQTDTSGSTPTLRAMGHQASHANAGGQLAVAFDAQAGGETALATGPVAGALHGGGKHGGRAAVATRWAVRRLTPMECERLQGFPDGYTDVPYRRRNETPDGPRYKALGNSMAVNAMEFIGRRIELVREVMAAEPELAAQIGKIGKWEWIDD